MIKAIVLHESDILRVLVDAESDLNVQNEDPQQSIIGGSDSFNDLSKEWEK